MIFNPNPPATDRKVRVFKLNTGFLEDFEGKQPAWGFGGLGYFTYKRTYARKLPDGTTEEFWQTCQRVVEGCFNIQKIHCQSMGLMWNEPKAQKSAQDMYSRLWLFKWTPPGRGLWMMGTDLIYEKGSAALQNCAFVSTENLDQDFAAPFCFLMDMSMLGVGVGGDTRGADKARIVMPKTTDVPFVVEDSREGWVELVRTVLSSFVGRGAFPLFIDYTKVRPRGAAIEGFGGIASGAGPLQKLVEGVTRLLLPKGVSLGVLTSVMQEDGLITSVSTMTDEAMSSVRTLCSAYLFEGKAVPYRIQSDQIVDVFNYIGKCVVAGGVRRTAEIMFGDAEDDLFLNLKSNKGLSPLYAKMKRIKEALEDPEALAEGMSLSEYTDLIRSLQPDASAEVLEQGWGSVKSLRTILTRLQGSTQKAIDAHPLNDRRWASNNSVFGVQGMSYETIAARIAQNGEPGICWLENARQFGRMADPANGKDYRIMGTNPCVTGDTIIFTGEGPARADKLIDKPFDAMVEREAHKSWTGMFQTGIKPVFLVQTKEGHSVKVTGDHRILTSPKLTRKKRYEAWVEAQDLEAGDKLILNNMREHTLPGATDPKHGWDALKEFAWDGRGTSEQGWLLGSLLGDGHFHAGQETAKVQFWGPTKDVMLEKALERIKTLGGDPRYHAQRTGTEVESRDLVSTGSRKLWELAPEFGISHDKDIINDTLLTASSDFQSGFLRGLFDADGSVQGTQEKGVSVRLASSNRQHLKVAQQMLMHFGVNSTIYWDRRDAEGRMLPNGSGGLSPYQCAAQHELVVSKDNLPVYAGRIGFDEPHKKERLGDLLDGYVRTLNRDRFVATVESVTYVGIEPVFDATVDGVHRFGANGITVHNCGEQSLESFELCNLVETYPAHHEDLEDYRRTLKMSYLYAKTVTLVPTHDHRANLVMQRNRRIGCSMSGIAQARQKLGHRKFLDWCDGGYAYIQDLDRLYSEWLGIPMSKKTTSVKPSGTVSLLSGATPGIHFPHSEFYIRRVRIANTSPLIQAALDAGYNVEADVVADDTSVVEFPVHEKNFDRSKADVSIWEQFSLAVAMQRHWADNQVSVTVTFKKSEVPDISRCLEAHEDQLKSISMMPLSEHGYVQAPYETIDEDTYNRLAANIKPLNFGADVATHDISAEDKFCSGDSCTAPWMTEN
jgi:intein/homing endonuclease